MQGCLGACTYCKTVHARGRLGSYDPAALLRRVRQAVADPEVTTPEDFVQRCHVVVTQPICCGNAQWVERRAITAPQGCAPMCVSRIAAK